MDSPRALRKNKYLDTLPSGLIHRKGEPSAKMNRAINQTLYPYQLLVKEELILD